MHLTKNIARNIRKYKGDRNISFLRIAKKAGIPYTTLENIIYSRKNDVQVSTLLKIAKVLGVSLDALVGYKPKKRPTSPPQVGESLPA